jgi:hypothetical protein
VIGRSGRLMVGVVAHGKGLSWRAGRAMLGGPVDSVVKMTLWDHDGAAHGLGSAASSAIEVARARCAGAVGTADRRDCGTMATMKIGLTALCPPRSPDSYSGVPAALVDALERMDVSLTAIDARILDLRAAPQAGEL